jgi:hypothetical protein
MIKNFPNPSATPIIGQPVTILRWVLPVTVEFMCNCQVPEGVTRTSLQMMASQPIMCPHCRMVYSAGYDPNTKGIGFILLGKAEPEPQKN